MMMAMYSTLQRKENSSANKGKKKAKEEDANSSNSETVRVNGTGEMMMKMMMMTLDRNSSKRSIGLGEKKMANWCCDVTEVCCNPGRRTLAAGAGRGAGRGEARRVEVCH